MDFALLFFWMNRFFFKSENFFGKNAETKFKEKKFFFCIFVVQIKIILVTFALNLTDTKRFLFLFKKKSNWIFFFFAQIKNIKFVRSNEYRVRYGKKAKRLENQVMKWYYDESLCLVFSLIFGKNVKVCLFGCDKFSWDKVRKRLTLWHENDYNCSLLCVKYGFNAVSLRNVEFSGFGWTVSFGCKW